MRKKRIGLSGDFKTTGRNHFSHKTKKQRKAKPPYTTSTMQQDAVNRLNFGSKKTMALAQMLYEGLKYRVTDMWG